MLRKSQVKFALGVLALLYIVAASFKVALLAEWESKRPDGQQQQPQPLPPMLHAETVVQAASPAKIAVDFAGKGSSTVVLAPPTLLAEPVVLRVLVLTMDRAGPLARLLASLRSAEYNGDRVDLDASAR